MRVQYVTVKGAENFSSLDEFRAAAGRLGLTEIGAVTEPHLNAGLQGLPTFKELAGPMGPHDQGSAVRYETWAAYQLYSS